MTIKFGNFANFIVRNFVVIWEAPIRGNGGPYLYSPPSDLSDSGDDRVGKALAIHRTAQKHREYNQKRSESGGRQNEDVSKGGLSLRGGSRHDRNRQPLAFLSIL